MSGFDYKCSKCSDWGYFVETDSTFVPDSPVKTYCKCQANIVHEKEIDIYECPDCGFRFDACHENDDERGGYSCPLCELDKLKHQVT